MKGSLARLPFLALALLGGWSAAQRQPPQVELIYEPAAGCPEQPALEAAVSARLGYWPFQAGASRRAEVRLKPQGVGLQGTLKLLEGDTSLGRRSFESAAGDCAELVSLLELALAIAIDPQAKFKPPGPAEPEAQPSSPPPRSMAAPTTAAVPSATAPSPEETRSPVHLSAGLSASLLTGLSPTPTAGFGLEVALRWRALEVSLGGRGNLASVVPQLETTSFSVSLAACGLLGYLSICGLGSGAVLQLTAPARRVSQPVALVGAQVGGRFEVLDRLWLLPFIQALGIPTRVSVVSGVEEVWTTPAVAISAGLSVRFEFLSEFLGPQPKSLPIGP